jgi:hypothetical protein
MDGETVQTVHNRGWKGRPALFCTTTYGLRLSTGAYYSSCIAAVRRDKTLYVPTPIL